MLPNDLPHLGGDVWARLVPGSLRPWILVGSDTIGTSATATGTVPVGMAGVITELRGVIGYTQAAGAAKINDLDWSGATLSVTVAGVPWTIDGTLVVPNPTLSALANLTAASIQAQFGWSLPLPAPIVLSQAQTITVATGGTWPHDCAVVQVWAIGYLGTPGVRK